MRFAGSNLLVVMFCALSSFSNEIYADEFSLNNLIQMEVELQQEANRILWNGFSVDDIRERLDDSEYLNRASEVHSRFQGRLDRYLILKLDYELSILMSELKEIHQEGVSQKEWSILEKDFQAWKGLSEEDRPRPSLRNRYVRNFLGHAAEYLHEREKMALPRRIKAASHIQKTLKAIYHASVYTLNIGILSPAIFLMYRKFRKPPNLERLAPGTYPFIGQLNALLRSFSWLRRHKIYVEKEAGSPPLPGAIELIAPVHRDIYMDPILAAHLPGIKGYRIFVDPERYLPDRIFIHPQTFIGRWINSIVKEIKETLPKHADFIPASQSTQPGSALVRMKKLLSTTESNPILIYPEGTTSLIGEVSPVTASFVVGFLTDLMKLDRDLSLSIVSNDQNPEIRTSFSERFWQIFMPRESQVTIKVAKALQKNEIRKIIEHGSGMKSALFLAHLMRAEWLQQLPTNETLLFGQLRVTALRAEFEKSISKRLHSKNLKSCITALKRAKSPN